MSELKDPHLKASYFLSGKLASFAREKLQISDNKLSKRTGVARSTLSKARMGNTAFTLRNFLAICEATGARPEDAILGRPEGNPPKEIHIGGHTYQLKEAE